MIPTADRPHNHPTSNTISIAESDTAISEEYSRKYVQVKQSSQCTCATKMYGRLPLPTCSDMCLVELAGASNQPTNQQQVFSPRFDNVDVREQAEEALSCKHLLHMMLPFWGGAGLAKGGKSSRVVNENLSSIYSISNMAPTPLPKEVQVLIH